MQPGTLLAGKRGLVMGVANDKSIAWGIAEAAAKQGAEIAFSYQMEGFGKRLAPLAESIGSSIMIECDVAKEGAVDRCFAELAMDWPTIDFVVHALAFSDKNELKGAYMDTSRENFENTMMVSAYSFTEVARAARDMMPDGGALVTLSFLGAQRSTPNYNVMGVAKAALKPRLAILRLILVVRIFGSMHYRPDRCAHLLARRLPGRATFSAMPNIMRHLNAIPGLMRLGVPVFIWFQIYRQA